MKGFSENCIFVGPKVTSCDSKPPRYWRLLRESCENMQRYLESCGTECMAFYTDEVLRQVVAGGITWLNPCTPEDSFFAAKNCEGMAGISNSRSLDKYYPKSREAYKVKRGMTVADRFDVVSKREKLVAKLIIESSRLVVVFGSKSSSYYKVKSAVDDKRLILWVNPLNFLVESEMSGAPVPLTYLIQDMPVNKPLYEWRVENV